jgi:hypothetical protein
MLKSTTHFEQVPLALVEKLVKPFAERISVARKKSKRKTFGTLRPSKSERRKGQNHE